MINPVEPNAVTCPYCGEPYIAEWEPIAGIASVSYGDQTFNAGFSVATTATHSPCPARPELTEPSPDA